VSRAPLIVLACGCAQLAIGARAAADGRPTVDAAALVGAGADSNLYLQVSASPTSPNFHPTPSPWFARVSPTLAAAWDFDRLRLSLSYDADLRSADGAGLLAIESATLEVAILRLGPFRARIGAVAGRYDNSRYAQDRFLSFGGDAGLALRISSAVHAEAGYRIERRGFADPTALGVSHDIAQVAEAHVAADVTPAMTFGATADLLALSSTGADPSAPAATLRRGRCGVDIDLALSALVSISATAWAGVQGYGGGGSDVQGGGGAAAVLRLNPWTKLVARYDLTVSRAESDATVDYSRQVALLALWFHARTPPRLPPTAAGTEAPLVSGGRVRFRLRAPEATSVVVVGAWNDWASGLAEQRLVRTVDPALWEGWLTIGSGAQRYRFVVDGKATRPVDAPEYRPDEFGGEDGLVTVP
jgi:hypothetical protein